MTIDLTGNPLSERSLTRRDFVSGSVGTGFAAAVMPVVSQTLVSTAATGLDAGVVSIPVGSFNMPAYRAVPADKRGAPVILVVSEIFGVHEYIADVARRLAARGYFAVAPELFVRQGDAKAYTDIPKLFSEVVSKAADAQVLGDLDAAVAWSKAQGADTGRLGITGFCWGGRITWLYGAHSAAVKAGVAWYGRLEGERNALQPRHPLQVVDALNAPVLGLYGGADTGIPVESVERMKAALAQGSPAARRSEFVVYPDAQHAFHADYRPSFRKEAAEDGWKRCLAWFASHGVA